MQESFVAAQNPVIHTPRTRAAAFRLPVSVFGVVVLAVAALAYILRFAELDTVPLFPTEVTRALAAWKLVHPDAWTTVTATDSPLLLALQGISFTLLGGHELASRVPTALAGIALVLSPLLFQRLLGRTRAVLLCIVLLFSPALLLASRAGSPVVWSLLLAVTGLWAAWRYAATHAGGYAVAATALFAMTALLAEPGGILLLLALLGAWLVTRWTARLDVVERDVDRRSPGWLSGWPWGRGLAVTGLLLFVISTVFMLHQRGVSNIGALLGAFVNNLTTPAPGTPTLYPLMVAVFYEPLAWVFAIIGLLLGWRRGFSAVDRFLTSWLLLGMVTLLVYPGASAAHALWVTVPLAGLVSRVALAALRDEPRLLWQAPAWARWLVAAVTIGLLCILALALQLVARSMTRLDPAVGVDSLARLDPIGMILIVMAVLFAVVGFFLVANVWDRPASAQGGALGLLVFSLVTSLGSGWSAAVPNAALATEPWHLQTTDVGAPLLRSTLFEVAKRESRGFPSLPVAAQSAGDDLPAWLLRDFTNVQPIASAADAAGAQVILLTEALPEGVTPDLGGNYVGQDFTLTRGWSLGNLRPYDMLAWWLQRQTPARGIPLQTATLWLRQDIYLGVDAPQ